MPYHRSGKRKCDFGSEKSIKSQWNIYIDEYKWRVIWRNVIRRTKKWKLKTCRRRRRCRHRRKQNWMDGKGSCETVRDWGERTVESTSGLLRFITFCTLYLLINPSILDLNFWYHNFFRLKRYFCLCKLSFFYFSPCIFSVVN
jgi:hypothetical protein